MQLAGVKMVGGVAVPGAAGVGEGEIHQSAQGGGGGKGRVGAQLSFFAAGRKTVHGSLSRHLIVN